MRSQRLVLSIRLLVGAVGLVIASSLVHAQQPQKHTPAEAVQKVGTTCSVEFIVKSVGHSKGDYYLNSEMNFQWPNNFTAVVSSSDASRFPGVGGTKGFEKYFTGKQIRVTGKVEQLKNVVGIRATGPSQLVVVNATPERDPIEVPPPPELTPDDADLRPTSYLRYYILAFGLVLLAVWYFLYKKKKAKEAEE